MVLAMEGRAGGMCVRQDAVNSGNAHTRPPESMKAISIVHFLSNALESSAGPQPAILAVKQSGCTLLPARSVSFHTDPDSSWELRAGTLRCKNDIAIYWEPLK
jgi:hypothetical protein